MSESLEYPPEMEMEYHKMISTVKSMMDFDTELHALFFIRDAVKWKLAEEFQHRICLEKADEFQKAIGETGIWRTYPNA